MTTTIPDKLPFACSQTILFPSRTPYTRVYPVAPKKHLVVLTCWMGPYWEATTNYLHDEAQNPPQVQSLRLPTYDRATGQVVPSQSNINRGLQKYEAEKRVLTLFHKFSGVGTCGMQATYRLENNEFTLTEFREKQECEGTNPPGDFPQVYP